MPTPHNSAAAGDFARTVLMPGDPLRSRYIAQEYLTEARLVNNIRGVQGYTGMWKGMPVSVMASGMGCPAVGIYTHELYTQYGVENIIRVGTCGAIREDLRLRDLVFAMGACTDSAFGAQYKLNGTFAPICSYELLVTAVAIAKEKNVRYFVGNMLSSDIFYRDDPDHTASWRKMGVLAADMEAAALYMTAASLGRRALTICTVSDLLFADGALTTEERQSSLCDMIETALDAAVSV